MNPAAFNSIIAEMEELDSILESNPFNAKAGARWRELAHLIYHYEETL